MMNLAESSTRPEQQAANMNAINSGFIVFVTSVKHQGATTALA